VSDLPHDENSEGHVHISRHDLIAEIVERFPGADEILMDFGIGCFNCAVSEFETLEQGILGHGFSEEELEEVLSDLNELAEQLEAEGELGKGKEISDDEF